MQLFEAKISYLNQNENGSISKKNDNYVIEAQTFTEAEANLKRVLVEYIPDHELKALKISRVNDCILNEDFETIYNVKIKYVSFDEDSGKEKSISEQFLAQCSGLDHCKDLIKEKMKGSIVDWHITSIKETNIIDIFVFNNIFA